MIKHLLRAVVLGMVLLGLAACGGGEDDGAAADSPAVADVDSNDAGAGDAATEDGGSEPEDTGGDAWTDADIEALLATEIEGYERQDGRIVAGNGNVSYITAGPSEFDLQVGVTLTGCDPFVCAKQSRNPSGEELEALRSSLSSDALENPDLVFDVGVEELSPGYEAFTVYSKLFEQEGGSTLTINSYTARYHDGSNLIIIRVGTKPGFDSPDSAEANDAAMDAETGNRVASEVFAAFESEFDANGAMFND